MTTPPITLRADPQLGAELDRLERSSLRVLQVFGGFGTASALLFALVSPTLGLYCTVAASAFSIWFFVAHRWLSSGRARRTLDWVTAVMESAVPWTFFGVLAVAEGTSFAVASWVPPMLFCAQIVAATVRLRPSTALVAGLLGGVAYPALSFVLARESIELVLGRSVALVVSGVIGALVSRALFRVYARAKRTARETDLFGKYRLIRPIASGGMGTVIEALYCPEGGFERRVAVKRVHAHLAARPELVDAFRREAEIGSKLGHPNIVQVLDFGRDGGSWFLAMEFVEGVTLDELLASPLPPDVAGLIIRELLAGLDHAHERARGDDGEPLRIVHRDLCPRNVLVSVSGAVKISDFGVARALGAAAMAHTHVTGHAGYVAPEQAGGDPIDVRADLFPVGVMLWELLSGRPLFQRDNEAATLNALLSEDIPSIGPAWDAVLARALARDPNERFESAQAMASALESIAEARSETSRRTLAGLVRSRTKDAP